MNRAGALALVLMLASCVTPAGQVDGETPTSGDVDPSTSPAPTGGESTPGASAGPSGLVCWTSPAQASGGIAFSDQTEAWGMVAPLLGMHGHAAIWGDVDGDDRLDLYVGTFADREAERYRFRGAEGPSPDRLLLGRDGGFEADPALPEMRSRTSGGVVADLDNDGDLDMVVSRNFDDDAPQAPPSQILRNDGGELVPVEASGLPTTMGGRSVAVLDYDLDGLLDLFIAEDRFSGGSSVLMRNSGGLSFEEATESAGLPGDIHGLGVVAADFNGDGLADILVSGSNRLFVAEGDATFREVDSSVFLWEVYGSEDDVAGVSVADVNRDGLLDVVIGQHYNSTVDDGTRVPVRLYINRGPDGAGIPRFEDVTDQAGLTPLPTKAPHVEINDIDNDGWPDIVTTASSGDGSMPAIFRHEGLEGDIPRFSTPSGLGHPQYWVAGPTADVDRDGRLDIFLVEWEPSLPSLMMRNESGSGHWLQVSVSAEHGFGIGWRVEVYRSGSVGEVTGLIGARDITVTQGYSAGVAPMAHFGLGDDAIVDVRLIPPAGEEPVDLVGLPADSHVRHPNGCG